MILGDGTSPGKKLGDASSGSARFTGDSASGRGPEGWYIREALRLRWTIRQSDTSSSYMFSPGGRKDPSRLAARV